MTNPRVLKREGMTMTPERRAALEAAGAVETTVAEFCGLSESEEKVVEYRLALAREARRLRQGRGLTQREMANLLQVSQSRIPLIERGETSLDAIAKAVVMLGGDLHGPRDRNPAQVAARGPKSRQPRSTGPLQRPPLMARRKLARKAPPPEI